MAQEQEHGRILIFINDERHFAPSPTMTGAELKRLGSVPPQNNLFLEQPGPDPDRLITDDEVVELLSGFKFYDLPPAIRG